MEEHKFWRSQVNCVTAGSLSTLVTAINDFCKDKFVVGIQYPECFQGKEFCAVVSYKVND